MLMDAMKGVTAYEVAMVNEYEPIHPEASTLRVCTCISKAS